jgi:enoyl-CoA hydratase/carnithine racemase
MNLSPKSFQLALDKGVVTITLDREKRLNALTFEVYQELAETFEALDRFDEVRAVVVTGKGRGFCSGGDQDDIIKHLLGRDTPALLAFTRATGRLIKAMRACKRPIVAAVNGTAVGAGAVIACASDFRIAAQTAKFGFIFPQVGLCGADMASRTCCPGSSGSATRRSCCSSATSSSRRARSRSAWSTAWSPTVRHA